MGMTKHHAVLLDMTINGKASVDKHGRLYLTFINPEIAKLIDRTSSTVGQALAELETAGLVKRHWVSRSPTQPCHTHIKLPVMEGKP